MSQLAPALANAPTVEVTRRPQRASGSWLALGFVALIASAWGVSRLNLFEASDDVSYWIAVVGGSMMAALLLYPLRKRVIWMQRLGRLKWWFVVHMILGLFGPWLILVHSTFELRSTNATVAMYSMCIVVLSGVIGRFIYVRVHRGLQGELTSFEALKTSAGLVESEARSWLRFAPEVEARLRAFEEHEHVARPGLLTWLRQATWLPLVQWWTYRRCMYDVARTLRKISERSGWGPDQLAKRERRSRKLVSRYLNAVVKVAQYTAFERLFALWHLAHIPVLILLIGSAVVHVIAVHAY